MVAIRAMLVAKQVTTTRCRQPATSWFSASSSAPSEPVLPSSKTLVESQTIASHALVAERAQRRLVRSRPHHRLGIELPVAGVQDQPQRGADGHRPRLGDRVRHADHLQIERADAEAAVVGDQPQRHLGLEAAAGELATQRGHGERRRIDRTAQPRPQIGHRAEMVLVGVGEQQAVELVAALGDERRIGHDHVGAGNTVAAERDAAVDHQPAVLVARAIAVEVEVHADLAGPAQWQEQQFGRCVGPGRGHRVRRRCDGRRRRAP